MKKFKIDEQVLVTAIGFRRGLIAYPRRIEYGGDTYDFIDAGLRCLVKCGGYIVEVVTMTDGLKDFRLRRELGKGRWTLLSISN